MPAQPDAPCFTLSPRAYQVRLSAQQPEPEVGRKSQPQPVEGRSGRRASAATAVLLKEVEPGVMAKTLTRPDVQELLARHNWAPSDESSSSADAKLVKAIHDVTDTMEPRTREHQQVRCVLAATTAGAMAMAMAMAMAVQILQKDIRDERSQTDFWKGSRVVRGVWCVYASRDPGPGEDYRVYQPEALIHKTYVFDHLLLMSLPTERVKDSQKKIQVLQTDLGAAVDMVHSSHL
jgi:hypothetical protein